MDLNIVVIAGRLAAATEYRELEAGRQLRLLVSVRSEEPEKRVDVLPVILWDPPRDLVDAAPPPGTSVWIAGEVQRRFWSGAEGRRSRLEIVARCVTVQPQAEVPDDRP